MQSNPWLVFHGVLQHQLSMIEGSIQFSLKFTDKPERSVTVNLLSRPPRCEWGVREDSDVIVSLNTSTLESVVRQPELAHQLFFSSDEISVDTKRPERLAQSLAELMNFLGVLHGLGDDRTSASEAEAVELDPCAEIVLLDNDALLVRSGLGTHVVTELDAAAVSRVLHAAKDGVKLSRLLDNDERAARLMLQFGLIRSVLTATGDLDQGEPAVGGHDPVTDEDGVLVVGNGHLAEVLHTLLREEGCKARILRVPERVANSLLGSHPEDTPRFYWGPHAPFHADPDEIEGFATRYREHLKTARSVICAAVGARYSAYLWMAELAAHMDVPFLPVTITGNTLEVGPTIVAGLAGNFFALRVPGAVSTVHSGLRLLRSHGNPKLSSTMVQDLRKAVSGFAKRCVDPYLIRVEIVSDPGASEGARASESLGTGARLADAEEGRFEPWLTSGSASLAIQSYLNDHVLDPSRIDMIRKGLESNRAVVVKSAFKQAFAEEVFDALDRCERWSPYESFEHEQFHYRHHNIYPRDHHPDQLLVAKLAFSSMQSRTFMQELASVDAMGEPEFIASRYFPGDYSTPHNDWGPTRRIAWIWHLTKDWNPRWGGDLFWVPSNTLLAPSFNTLTLFRVHERSTHCVLPVTPTARGKRLTVNGWYCSSGKSLWSEKRASLPTGESVVVL